MTDDLSTFFDRFDAMKPNRPVEQALTDEGLQDASRSVMPLYQQLAERCDVDLEQLFLEQVERHRLLPGVIVARGISTGHNVQSEILGAIANVASESFMAGVLWQQARELPSLEDLGDGS